MSQLVLRQFEFVGSLAPILPQVLNLREDVTPQD